MYYRIDIRQMLRSRILNMHKTINMAPTCLKTERDWDMIWRVGILRVSRTPLDLCEHRNLYDLCDIRRGRHKMLTESVVRICKLYPATGPGTVSAQVFRFSARGFTAAPLLSGHWLLSVARANR